ncbi:hypothetical protein Catovirus_1_1013 [Catovirus CTV1]|uniref:Uncharacterized protein n=1 Tax=Catovirus CTV1 TaxID=1977631 RepID=A0A1V0SB77_9VIRU|nr:hypothetical protein Catovirus_1_1013 [Catovirus CTV1]
MEYDFLLNKLLDYEIINNNSFFFDEFTEK